MKNKTEDKTDTRNIRDGVIAELTRDFLKDLRPEARRCLTLSDYLLELNPRV